MAGMQVLKSFGKLVYNEFYMDILEYTLRNHIVQVGFHKLEN